MRYDELDMASCPSCGAHLPSADAPCPQCGRGAVKGKTAAPALELDVPARREAKPALPKKKHEEEIAIELAVDPRSLRPDSAGAAVAVASVPAPGLQRASIPSGGSPSGAMRRVGSSKAPAKEMSLSMVGELAFDARLLAEYGDPPKHWILSPFYTWRVIRRQRELRHALVGRREEAARATSELEDALVAFAERVRPAAEKQATYGPAFEDLRRAEEALRSRDRVLASDQDAQTARLASVDARLSKLEGELAKAQADERAVMGEIGSTMAALGREESKLKRAESELRAAQRDAGGSTS
jgi:hypothetical protein